MSTELGETSQTTGGNNRTQDDENETNDVIQDETNLYLQSYIDDDIDAYSAAAASCALTASTIAEGIAHTISHWKILAFGQWLSILLTIIGATSSTLSTECQLSAPTFQFMLLYFVLSLHFFVMFGKHLWSRFKGRKTMDATDSKKDDMPAASDSDALRFDDEELRGVEDAEPSVSAIRPKYTLPCTSMPIRGPWWFYFVIAVLDVEANFFTILSFRYTTLTSVALFDSLAIPGAMITSKWILGSKYGTSHLIGALVCLLGVIVNVLVDLEELSDPETGINKYPHKLLGDVLAIAGGILYGVNDALEELVVRRFSMQEYLAFTGLYGSFISIVQVYILEIDSVAKFFDGSSECSQKTSMWLLFAFVAVNYVSYLGVARFLVVSEAALLNLSLLTSDLYAVIFSVFAQNIIPEPAFYFALLLIFCGVVVYESGPSPMVKANDITAGDFVLEFGTPEVRRPTGRIV